MSDQDAHEREHTIFDPDGPIKLTEHELLNEYMRLRDENRVLVMENAAMSMASRGRRVWEPARTEDSERIARLYERAQRAPLLPLLHGEGEE